MCLQATNLFFLKLGHSFPSSNLSQCSMNVRNGNVLKITKQFLYLIGSKYINFCQDKVEGRYNESQKQLPFVHLPPLPPTPPPTFKRRPGNLSFLKLSASLHLMGGDVARNAKRKLPRPAFKFWGGGKESYLGGRFCRTLQVVLAKVIEANSKPIGPASKRLKNRHRQLSSLPVTWPHTCSISHSGQTAQADFYPYNLLPSCKKICKY